MSAMELFLSSTTERLLMTQFEVISPGDSSIFSWFQLHVDIAIAPLMTLRQRSIKQIHWTESVDSAWCRPTILIEWIIWCLLMHVIDNANNYNQLLHLVYYCHIVNPIFELSLPATSIVVLLNSYVWYPQGFPLWINALD